MTLDPHRVYIEFLATRHADEAGAGAILDSLEMPRPYPGSFGRIREILLSKAPTEIRLFLEGKCSLPTLQPLWEWALAQRFGVFWAQEPIFQLHDHRDQFVFNKAWEVLRNIPLRNTIDAVLTQQWGLHHGFDIEKLNDVISVRFGETVHETTFEMYRTLFFNPSRVARANWSHYLEGCHPTRKEMLLLAMGQRDEKRFRHDLGAPPRFQYTHLLTDVMATAYYRFKEEDAAAAADPKTMNTWAKMMMNAGEAREKHGQKDLADLRRDLQLGFTFLEADFPTLEEVEAGHLDRALGFGDDPE